MAEPTGRRRFRAGYRGCLVLQIEERRQVPQHPGGSVYITEWRDARIEDLTAEDEIQPLLLRSAS